MSLGNKILEIVDQFGPISLKEMDSVKLMQRLDAKYVFPLSKLPILLETALNNFRILEIDGHREQLYETTYFDTPDYRMFHVHHNGRSNRHKIRIRNYVYSKQEFLEVKRKNNKGETIKTRIGNHPAIKQINCETNSAFLSRYTPYNPDELLPMLGNRFIRLTLVNKNFRERVTIDYQLEFTNLNNGEGKLCPGICIAEVKCSRDDRRGAFTSLINQLRIRQSGFSKYCVGTALLNPEVKSNLFKPRLKSIEKIMINQS
jgi:hypothetical protein